MTKCRKLLSAALAGVLLACSTPVAFGLPAEIEADRLVLAAEEKIAQQDFDGARGYLERVESLKAEPRPGYYYLYGQVLFRDGSLEKAQDYLTRYVTKAGREGEYYDDALRMLTQVEEQLDSRREVTAGRDRMQDLKAIGLEAGDSEGKAYDDKVRKLYLNADLRDALATHINSLLKSYAWMSGKVKNPDQSDLENYSLSLAGTHDIVVSKTEINHSTGNGEAQMSTSRLNALGVNPFVTFRCSKSVDSCIIRHPVSGQDWIRIADDEAGAKELALALTRLIKALQR